MQCAACRGRNPAGAAYCAKCGAPLSVRHRAVCPACGAALAPRARFCPACGAALTSASRQGNTPPPSIPPALRRLVPPHYIERVLSGQGRLQGERRVVTILFSDVKDSTAISESLDPEDVMAIMNGAFEVLIEPVYRYEGTLARLMGDAILAFFGAPIAHEDDPIRACMAALEIVEGAARYADRLRRERDVSGFNVRVGINTGIVVVGEVGADLRVEYTAMGDAVNLAARMEGAADPGTILITDDTWRQVSHVFRTESVGPLRVKGRSEPVCAHRLVCVAHDDDRDVRGQRRTQSPLVGRTEELRRLEAACASLTEGRGGCVAVVADAGLGKTRLVSEARARRPPGVAWAGARAVMFGHTRGYGLAQRVLISLLGLDADDPSRGLAEAVHRVVPEGAAQVVPYLARLLDLDDWPSPPAAASPDVTRRRVVQAFVQTVRAIAERHPLVMVWEDLQWIDPLSLELVRAVLRLSDSVPLLLVFTFRPEAGPFRDYHRQLVKRYGERYQIIELARLTQAETTTLLDALVANEKPPAWLIQQLVERAEGNPLYVEEWVSTVEDGPGWQKLGHRETTGTRHDVPASLRAASMAQLDRLPPDRKHLLQVAALIGRVFPADILKHALGDEHSCADLRAALKDLERRKILFRLTEGGDQAEYGFAGALMADVASSNLLFAERRRLHRRVAEGLGQLRAARLGPLSSTIADHYEEAGLTERALEYWLRGAGRAAQLAADAEALACYQRALRLAGDTAPAEVRLTIHEGLADASCRLAGYTVAKAHYDLALGLAPDRPGRIVLLRKLGSLHERAGRYSEALGSYQAALDTMGRDLDEAELSRIYSGLGLVHSRLGARDAALQMTQLALALQEALGDEVAIAQTCNSLGIVQCARAEYDAAIECHVRALGTWERQGDLCGLAASHNNLGLVHASRGDHARALEHYRTAVSMFDQAGNAHGVARACDNMGRSCSALGLDDEAMCHLGRAVAILDDLAVTDGELAPEMWQSGAW